MAVIGGGVTPWYMYPLDNPGGGYQEMTDPMGNYLKPDTNIRVPSGVAITTWDSGVITSVVDRGRSLAGLSVTEKLDHPPNNQAQYASFNYLGSANVSPGQHVNAGQQIGVAGSRYNVYFALGLGTSPVWGDQCPQCSSKQPNLDPRIILNQLRSGSPLPPGASASLSPQAQAQLNAQNSIPFGLGPLWTSVQSSFTNFAEEAGVFILALVIIILGIMLLMGKQISGFVESQGSKAVKAGELAAA